MCRVRVCVCVCGSQLLPVQKNLFCLTDDLNFGSLCYKIVPSKKMLELNRRRFCNSYHRAENKVII